MINEPNQCPIRFGLGVFGDRWSLLIIRDMMFRGHTRFQDFLDAAEGISTNVLADRLSRLETQHIIKREKNPDDGRQVLYRLTDKGRGLLPVMLAIFAWAEEHDPETSVPPYLAARIRTGFVGSQDELLTEIKQTISDT